MPKNQQPSCSVVAEVQSVTYTYPDAAAPAIENISLRIERGDYLGLIGPNGAGKSTLLRILLNQLHPQVGSVSLFDLPLDTFTDWQKIGYVPQKVTHFDSRFPATVGEVVRMGTFANRGILRPFVHEDMQKAEQMLLQVGMEGYTHQLIGDLSGGQQQRVFIARALASDPEVLFLDEPTTGLDPASQEELYSLLRVLNREKQMTLVLVSHDISRVSREANKVACVERFLTCHDSPDQCLIREHPIWTEAGNEHIHYV